MKRRKVRPCNPQDPSTEHYDVEVLDLHVMETGTEETTKGGAIYYVMPTFRQIADDVFGSTRDPKGRLRAVEKHARERKTIDGEPCSFLVAMGRQNEAHKGVSVYVLHGTEDHVKRFLYRRDQARIAGHLGQRTRAHRAEWAKWVHNEVVVLQENCLAEDPPDHFGWHICQTVIDEFNSTGTVTERTWGSFREWLVGPIQ